MDQVIDHADDADIGMRRALRAAVAPQSLLAYRYAFILAVAASRWRDGQGHRRVC